MGPPIINFPDGWIW